MRTFLLAFAVLAIVAGGVGAYTVGASTPALACPNGH